MRSMLRPGLALLVCVVLGLVSTATNAQRAPLYQHWEPYRLESGSVANPTPYEGVVYWHLITLPVDVPWLRLHFTRVELSPGSYLRMTSLRDGDVQTMHQIHVEQWNFSSAFFNGNAVMLEIVAGPDTPTNRVEIERVWAGEVPPPMGGPETICGANDSRIPDSHPAIGRLCNSALTSACTGWIINSPSNSNDKCHLSAGHCFPDFFSVLQFYPPPSAANCALAHPPARKQFAVNTATVVAVSNGLGDDYAVFKCFANSTTGMSTYEEMGATLPISTAAPTAGTIVRVTGYGIDGTDANNAPGANASCTCTAGNGTGTRNQYQQTDTGAFVGISGTTLNYQIDACGGNSGSPVESETTHLAVAIHTHGGCGDPVGSTSNSGTLLSNAGLQTAIANCGTGTTGPRNDECNGALPLVGGSNGPFSNTNATTSAPGWSCGSVGRDVWFTFVTSCAGPLTLDTCTATRTIDTVVQAFGGSCGALIALGCNDNGAGACGGGSRLTINVAANTQYYFRIGGVGGAQGAFDLTVVHGSGNGSITRVATGCGPTQITATGLPNLNRAVAISLGNLVGVPFIALGLNPRSIPLCPPATCTLGHDFLSVRTASDQTLVVPCDPAFSGVRVYVQGGDIYTAGGCSFGSTQVAVTDTLVLTIG